MNKLFGGPVLEKCWIDLPLVVSPVILFINALIPGKTLYWGIISLQFIPWHWEALRLLQTGELPLWNLWNGMGAPLLANYQSALLYPPTWLVLLAGWIGGIAWMAWSHGLLIVLHLVWAGLGMRRLAGFMGMKPFPQILCGLAYGLCGYLVARGSFLTMVQSASWVPWILLAASRFSIPVKGIGHTDRGIDYKGILYLTLAFTGQWLSGHAQLAWYTLLFCLIWLAAGALINGGLPLLKKIVLPVGVSGLLGFLLSSLQLIPTIEYFLQSQRAGEIDYETALSYSFWPWRFFTFLLPDFFGNPGNGDYWGYGSYWEDAIYIGLLPVIFSFFIVFKTILHPSEGKIPVIRSYVWFSLIAIIFITILGLGWNTPVFPWLFENIPTFGSFNGPARWMLLVDVCLILLAGYGANEWMDSRLFTKKWVNLGIAGMSGMIVCIAFAWYTQPDITRSLMYSMLSSGILALGYFIFARFKPEVKKRSKWLALILIWFYVDLFSAGYRLNPVVDADVLFPVKQPADLTSTVKTRSYISTADERALRFDRFFLFDNILPSDDLRNLPSVMLPNSNLFYSANFLNNFDPMLPSRFQGFMEEVDIASPDIRDRYLSFAGVDQRGKINPFNPNDFKWEKIVPYSQYRVLYCPDYVKDGNQALLQLRKAAAENKLDDLFLLEVDQSFDLDCVPPINQEPGISNEVYQSTRKVYEVTDNPANGWLVVSDIWYPGWQAEVDGRPVDIDISNYVFQAIAVPEGSHRIELHYAPSSAKIGVASTIMGIIVILGSWVYLKKDPGGHIERQS